mmetsp:Transcript_31005/g.45150  ORF Transcript_31005/g.45150 Transcript_31005/m.45150 type:complete len:94 (+) Transcript_31005:639-920(+)
MMTKLTLKQSVTIWKTCGTTGPKLVMKSLNSSLFWIKIQAKDKTKNAMLFLELLLLPINNSDINNVKVYVPSLWTAGCVAVTIHENHLLFQKS